MDSSIPTRYEGDGLSVARPEGWSLLRGMLGAAVVFLEPIQGDLGNLAFRSSINLTTQPVPKDFKEEVSRQVADLPRHLTDYRRDDEGEAQVAGSAAIRITGRYRHGTTVVRIDQWFVPTTTRIVAISAAFPDEREKEMMPVVEEVVESLSIDED